MIEARDQLWFALQKEVGQMKTSLMLIYFMVFAGCSLDDTERLQEGSQAEESQRLAQPGSDAMHCAIPTTAVPIGQDLSDVPRSADSLRCFSSFSQAIGFATQGRVQLPEDATPQDLGERAMGNASLTSFVIGVEYKDANYGNSSLTFYSGVTCNGYNHYASSMPSGWNDIISSALAYSYCNHSYHYEHIYYGGAMVDCHAACSYIGSAMNDRTSSIIWTQ